MIIDPIYIVAILSGFVMACSIGANDVANAMGTSVGSRALSVNQAIVLAAVFEALGALLAGGQVTNTIRDGVIDSSIYQQDLHRLAVGMLSSLWASGSWLVLATFRGWPVSTTHTIIGSVLGFALMSVGLEGVRWKLVFVVFGSWAIAPIVSAMVSFVLFKLLLICTYRTRNPHKNILFFVPMIVFISQYFILLMIMNKGLKPLGLKIPLVFQHLSSLFFGSLGVLISYHYLSKEVRRVNKDDHHDVFIMLEKVFAILSIFSAAVLAFAHGSNDVANAIGPLATIVDIVKYGTVDISRKLPMWIVILGASGVVVGLAVYGYRIMETVGKKITYLSPSRSFTAQLTTGLMVISSSAMGYPVSTTQILVGAVVGVGFAGGLGALNTKVIRDIVLSWVVTIPVGVLLSMIYYIFFIRVF